MGPDQPPMLHTATESGRMLGELWLVSEADADMPEGGRMKSVLTLGYDPERKQFIGTFISSMMTYLWLYEDGQLDEAGKKLTLHATGPSFASERATAKYQDIFEFHSADHRTLTSLVQQDDGTWQQVVKVDYRRIA